MVCASTDLMATKRMVGWEAAIAIASASWSSFLPLLRKRGDERRGDQPHGVTARSKQAPPVMRRAAGFHCDDAGAGKRCQPALEGGAAQALALDDLAGVAQHTDSEHLLCQIDPDGCTLFHDFPSWFRLMQRELQSWHLDAVRLRVASGRGSPFYSFNADTYKRRWRAALRAA
jgi:hypothetical protein